VDRSDHELLRACRRGDKKAFEELVQRYQRKVLAVAVGMVHNPEDAMEIAQDSFVKAFQNLDRFKGESSFYTWLYRIVVNRAIDFQRRQRRHPTVAFEEGGVGDEVKEGDTVWNNDASLDPFRRAQSQEIGERVAQAVDELTPDHKAVILLREVEGLSYEEISRVMQCSKGTVMSRLHYARKKLQKRLKDFVE
jgi:RNA polymerase sigma-70 factor (ECF subfamily)